MYVNHHTKRVNVYTCVCGLRGGGRGRGRGGGGGGGERTEGLHCVPLYLGRAKEGGKNTPECV